MCACTSSHLAPMINILARQLRLEASHLSIISQTVCRLDIHMRHSCPQLLRYISIRYQLFTQALEQVVPERKQETHEKLSRAARKAAAAKRKRDQQQHDDCCQPQQPPRRAIGGWRTRSICRARPAHLWTVHAVERKCEQRNGDREKHWAERLEAHRQRG